MDQDWMSDPSLAHIEKNKLQFMQKMFVESRKLSQKEMMPFFMSLAMKSKREKIQFTQEEAEAVIAVLKKNSSEQELSQMDQIMKMYQKKSGAPKK